MLGVEQTTLIFRLHLLF